MFCWRNKSTAEWVVGVLTNRIGRMLDRQTKQLEGVIMATREELLAEIGSINAQVKKATGEVVAKIGALETKLSEQGQPITLEDLAELRGSAQAADDVVADDGVTETVEDGTVA